MKKNKRLRFIEFLDKKIAKTPVAVIPPKWITIIYYILFPIRSLHQRKNKWCYYDFIRNEYTIEGIKFDLRKLNRYINGFPPCG